MSYILSNLNQNADPCISLPPNRQWEENVSYTWIAKCPFSSLCLRQSNIGSYRLIVWSHRLHLTSNRTWFWSARDTFESITLARDFIFSALKFLLKFLAQSGSSNFTKILKALNVSASYRGAVSGLTESCIINIRVLGSQPRNNTPYNRNQQEAAHLLPNRHRSAPSSFGFTNCWNFNYEVTFDHIFFISRFNIDTHQQKLSNKIRTNQT